MSLVLGFTNGEVAHVVSDGTIFDGTQVLARGRRKFFETPSGLIIGTAGFVRNCDEVERDFGDSRLDFFPTVRALERRVASAYSDLQGYGLPLGVIVVGRDGERIRIANIAKHGATLSTPDVPFASYLAAGDAADDSMLQRLCYAACAQPNEEARKKFLHEIVRIFAERTNQIGGEIFSASLPHPPMCPLNNQASLVGSPQDTTSYTSTSSSVTWNWSAFTVYFPDGSSLAVSSGSQSFTGLSSTTTYYFSMYIVKATGVLTVVLSDGSSGTAPSSLQQQAQTVGGDGHIPLWIDRTGATISGGGSGGGAGGGGTCFSGDTQIETDSGFVRMDALPVEFTVVNRTGSHRARLIVHENSTEPMRVMSDGALVTEAHLLQREDGSWSPASEIFSETAPSATRAVYDVHVITENPEDMHYILENGYIAHNKKRVCFSGDTFVQTTDGWLPMPELPPEFEIINREGTFKARVVRHENCNEPLYQMPDGASVTGAHLLRPRGSRKWFMASDIFPKSTEVLSTLFNIRVDGSDHFEIFGGWEANDMEGMS